MSLYDWWISGWVEPAPDNPEDPMLNDLPAIVQKAIDEWLVALDKARVDADTADRDENTAKLAEAQATKSRSSADASFKTLDEKRQALELAIDSVSVVQEKPAGARIVLGPPS